MTSIDVETLAQWRAEGRELTILDVRELDEVELVAMPGALHVPMAEVPARLSEIDPARTVVVTCHHGLRSARVAAYLRREGYREVLNLSGGIDAWAALVEPGLRRY